MSIFAFGSHLAMPRDGLSFDRPGQFRERFDADNGRRVEMRVYNAAATTVAKQWFELAFDGDEETNPKIVAIASGATSGTATGAVKYVCVATEAVATGNWTWVVVHGYYSAFVEGATDVTKDDYLKFDSSVSVLAPIKDATARTTSSVAIACENQTTAGNATAAKVYILGEKVLIAV